jgi:signal peptide peptidase SppA
MNNAIQIQASLLGEAWAMEPRALESFLARVTMPAAGGIATLLPSDTIFRVQGATTEVGRAGRRGILAIEGGVATIQIRGVLLRQISDADREFFDWIGVEATSYVDIVQAVEAAAADPAVTDILLAIDSPGGQVAGVTEAADAIASAGRTKRVACAVDGLCASGAYWLGSQASEISAGPNDQIGSIGVYTVYYDSSQRFAGAGVKAHLIASGTHKGMGVPGVEITPEQLAATREVIDGMAANFRSAVARGRRRGDDVVAGWASGRVWLAGQARELGLIDRVHARAMKSSGDGRPAAGSSSSKGEVEMANPTTPQAAAAGAEDIRTKAVEDERRAERDRIAAIRAAFPKHPQFALEQCEKGATLAEAKAAYADLVIADNERLLAENASLKQGRAEIAPAGGVAPLTSDGEPCTGGSEPPGFLARAEALAAERKWSLTQAMSHLARTEPELFERHCQAAIDGSQSSKVDRKFQRIAR